MFLANFEFGKELSEGETSDFSEFRLIVLLLEISCTRSIISKRLYRFRPELTLEVDNSGAFELFTEFCRMLVDRGVVSLDESIAVYQVCC